MARSRDTLARIGQPAGSQDATPFPTAPYFAVLSATACCYAALGAVVRILPAYLGRGLAAGPVADV